MEQGKQLEITGHVLLLRMTQGCDHCILHLPVYLPDGGRSLWRLSSEMPVPLWACCSLWAPECNSQVLASGFLVEKGTRVSSGWVHREAGAECYCQIEDQLLWALFPGRLVSQPHPWVPGRVSPALSWLCAGPGVLSFPALCLYQNNNNSNSSGVSKFLALIASSDQARQLVLASCDRPPLLLFSLFISVLPLLSVFWIRHLVSRWFQANKLFCHTKNRNKK